jgi:menaquinone-dependent protoporphyrinogen IX oxidase
MNKRQFFKTGMLGMVALALPKRMPALEFYPTKSDKKWAVLYGTWCGSSRDAGVWISEGMDGISNVFDVRENPDLTTYDHVIIGGSIRAGKVPEMLQQFIEKNRDQMKGKIRGLFVVCGNRMQPPGPEQKSMLIDNHLAKLCGVENLPSKVLLGRVTYGLMDEQSRKMLQGMNMPEYDNLKRSECMAFGKEVFNANPA